MADFIVVNIEKEDCSELSFVPLKEHANVNGFVHGGVLFYVCDELIGRYVTAKGMKGAAADAGIHYYRPAIVGQKLMVKVSERKVGKRLGTYLVTVTNEEGKIVADSMFTAAFG